MRTHLLLWLLLMVSLGNAQQITLNTAQYSGEEGVIEENRYWNSFDVLGEGFAPNSQITVYAVDPNGVRWRDFVDTSDADGNFEVQISAKKTRSVLGTHTVIASDAEGNSVSADLIVTANVKEVLDVSVDPQLLSQNDFHNGGVNIQSSGIVPNALVDVTLLTPGYMGAEVEPTVDKYADANGNYEKNINAYTVTENFGEYLGAAPGLWYVNVFDFSGNGNYGEASFRILPNNPSQSNYCEISQFPHYLGENKVFPITSFEIVESSTPPNVSSVGSTDFYEDFTNVEFELNAGETYTVKIKGKNGISYAMDTYTLFIDWNRNGILDEENEVMNEGYLFQSTGEDGKFTEFQITVPGNAVNGPTRMRVLKINLAGVHYLTWPFGACGTYSQRGQAEDYTLNISGGAEPVVCEIICPEDIVVQAEEGQSGVVVEYEVNFECEEESEGVELVLAQGLVSGSQFPIGTITVTHNLVYEGNVIDTCSFDVTVEERLGVSDVDNQKLSFYPNPVKDVLNIAYDKEISNVSIFDLSGKLVHATSIHNKNAQLNLTQLPAGVYVIKAEVSGDVKTFKIMKK